MVSSVLTPLTYASTYLCLFIRFANAPVNAQGGKQFDAPAEPHSYQSSSSNLPPNPFARPSDVPDGASQYETAEQEKARLQQQYAAAPTSDAAPHAPSSLPSHVEALYDFAGQEQTDLYFKTGDVIQVTGQEDEMWWRGTVDGRSGIFPSNYTRAV